jgi:hypothetical protein
MMMKTCKIFLHRWIGDSTDGYINIPWPAVHQAVGHDIINWIQDRDPTHVQLILEKTIDGYQQLYVDFYNHGLRTEFALTFAK